MTGYYKKQSKIAGRIVGLRLKEGDLLSKQAQQTARMKSLIQTIYRMCDTAERTQAFPAAEGGRLREICRADLIAFSLRMIVADGAVRSEETALFNALFDMDHTPDSLREAVKADAYPLLRPAAPGTAPEIYRRFLAVDREHKSTWAEQLLSSFEVLGEMIVASDDTRSFSERAALEEQLAAMRALAGGGENVQREAPSQGAAAEAAGAEQEQPTLEELMEELDGLVGLANVKEDVKDLANLLRVRKMRRERGFPVSEMSNHMVFSGNPGTGKTTIARLLARIYRAMGLLSKGQLVETDREGLVAGYVGQTAIKTKEVLARAAGGVLFIDEAYALTEGKGGFGGEAVAALLKGMEDNRDDLVVIVAGYPDLMEKFLRSNPGLRSRFNKFLHFVDYTAEELTLIFVSMCEKAGLALSSEAEAAVRAFFLNRCRNKPEGFANARDVRNFFEKMLVNQANRISAISASDADITDAHLAQIMLEDVADIAL